MIGKARRGRINGESEQEVEPQAPVVVPIARDVSGDGRERFDAEALRHREGIYHAAHRLTGNTSDAEDLAQETYQQALRASHRFRLGTNLKAWLFTILRNLVRNRRRSAARAIVEFDSRKVDQSSELTEERETPEQALLKKAGNADLQAAFESLPAPSATQSGSVMWRSCRMPRSPDASASLLGQSCRGSSERGSDCMPVLPDVSGTVIVGRTPLTQKSSGVEPAIAIHLMKGSHADQAMSPGPAAPGTVSGPAGIARGTSGRS